MRKYREHLIPLHYCVLGVIALATMQCLMGWMFFKFVDVYGHTDLILLHLNITVEVLRSTISRVVLLLLGLGFGILIKTIERYTVKILMLTFLYMISLAAELNVLYAD